MTVQYKKLNRKVRLLIIATLLAWNAGLVSPVVLNAESRFSAERLTEAAQKFIIKAIGSDADLDCVGRVNDQVFSQEGIIARFRKDANSSPSFYNVVVEFLYNQHPIRQITIPYRVIRYRMVPVATRPLGTGIVVGPEDIRLERRALTTQNAKAPEFNAIIGTKISRPVDTDELVTQVHISPANSILRGQNVTLMLHSGSITIQTSAKALSDAAPGESLQVIRSGSRTPIAVIAEGDGLVRLDI